MAQSKYRLNKNKYLIDPEVQKLEEILHHFLIGNQRDCLILLLALKTGARASELLSLQKSDLNDHEETIFIKGIKGSNDREIPLPSSFYRELTKYTASLSTQKIFPISYSRLQQIWLHYRPTPKKFHALRHTFAIRVYKKTKDIRLVQVALGHRNIMNTMIYADYVYSQQEMKKIII